ncbi:hypothetical protein GCM10020295_36860 [Streptomyces cinereospinus]
MSDPAAASADEPIRVSDHDLDDLAATLERLVSKTEAQGRMLERLKGEDSDTHPTPDDAEDHGPEQEDNEPRSQPDSVQEAAGDSGPASVFILALDNKAYGVELDALTGWVNHLLLPVYGREITTSRPWCHQWHEHPEAVTRLHALWLAWQQFTDVEAGLAAPRSGTATTSTPPGCSCALRTGRSPPAPPAPTGPTTGSCPPPAPRTDRAGTGGLSMPDTPQLPPRRALPR